MHKTLIARISNLKQYNPKTATLVWKDSRDSVWTNVYSKLQQNDIAIFIAKNNKLLIGNVSTLSHGQSVSCSKIEEIECSNDQFLQLHEIYPELISRVKANFQSFIHPQELDIPTLILDAKNKNYISYYILAGIEKYHQQINSFKENDRIILLNNDQKLENVKLHSANGLINVPKAIDAKIRVAGLTLSEIYEKNNNFKRETVRSNNLTRIQKIQLEIAATGIYKFNTFFSYHDALFNKRVYGEEEITNSSVMKVHLKNNESVYKVSMSRIGTGIDDDAFTYFNENYLISVNEGTGSIGGSSKTQGEIFSNQIKIGDYFYLCRGNENLECIGRITGDAIECEYLKFGEEGWLQRSYELIADAVNTNSYKGDKKWWTPNNNSTCIPVPMNQIELANAKIFTPFFNIKFDYLDDELPATREIEHMKKSLNQILFGPPGTGKTYNTINKALEIIGENIDGKNRHQVKEIFDAKVGEGQISFATFHQSMSYEDFIEGIKPLEPEKEGDPVIYKIQLGIFRRLCIEASFSIAELRLNKTTEKVLDFSLLYDVFADEVEEKILKGEKVELVTKTGAFVLIESISQQGNFVLKHANGNRTYTVSKARLSKLHSAISTLEQISNISDKFRQIIGGSNSSLYWSVLNAINKIKPNQSSRADRKYTFEEKKEAVAALSKSDFNQKDIKPFVLIIDEINRGNVSQIFGELITLIEEDKRLGEEEGLEVILPYSKEKFGIPNNLYIIGTMNTADRSVEALDSALRRRFSFEEMRPNSELVETPIFLSKSGIDLSLLITTINKRIEKLIDKDHQIGHSYFMSIKNMSEFKAVFKNKIIPLLQEYFFGDHGKIGLVIGQGFFEPVSHSEENIFADFDDYDATDFAERPVYNFKNLNEMLEDEFINAINLLLKI